MPSAAGADEIPPDTPITPDGIEEPRTGPARTVESIQGQPPLFDDEDIEDLAVEEDREDGAEDYLPALDGDFGTSVVYGEDDRVRATPTTTYPSAASYLITFETPDGSAASCTGFAYGPEDIATAGHCLYTHGEGKEGGGWNRNFVIHPARDAHETPFGTCVGLNATSVVGWTEDEDFQFDYGYLRAMCPDPYQGTIGEWTGTLGMSIGSGSMDGLAATINGYPAEKSPSNSQWFHNGPIEHTHARQLLYRIDTTPGQSGSPVRIGNPTLDCDYHCAIAIHSSGPMNLRDYNHGVRFVPRVLENYAEWMSDGGAELIRYQ
ncbi:serine protease [Nocardiopsis oceani]